MRELPTWLLDQWAVGEADGTLPRHRAEERRNVTGSCYVRIDPKNQPILAHVFNINRTCSGIGLILRQKLELGQLVTLLPPDGDGEAVKATIEHCTQTVQGFKIGCSVV